MFDAHYIPERYGHTTPFGSPIGICEGCGEMIYPGEQSLRVYVTDALIHSACWEDYAADRVYELAERVEFDDGEEEWKR